MKAPKAYMAPIVGLWITTVKIVLAWTVIYGGFQETLKEVLSSCML